MEPNKTGWVQTVSVPPPTLQNNTADADRLIETLKTRLKTDAVDLDFALLKPLPERLRNWNYQVRCTLFRDGGRLLITHMTDARDERPIAGLAVDLGTTRVILRLLDLSSGDTMTELAFDNPQMSVGPDILTRIHHADQENGLDYLHRLIIDGLNRHIADICRIASLEPIDIHAVSIAGNTTMTHLFMGLPPRWIVREPYIPVVNRPGTVRAEKIGIHANPAARMFIFPNIGSYFGGDLIAGILFSGLHKQKNASILVDVGTNAEVVLGNENWLIGCAGAAGPALEGGAARMGMTAMPGVIDRVSIDPKTGGFHIHTIDELPPKGICGSGLIDLAANLFLSGMMDIRGRLVPGKNHDRFKEKDGTLHLVVVPENESATRSDLTISQPDLDSLIRSKAAMYTILETITASVEMSMTDISTFYVAGTFGSFIHPRSAISIGMIPDIPMDRFKSLGNSSIGGASMVLTSSTGFEEIDTIRDRITYLELNVNQAFMNRFSAAKFLPHTDRSRFPTVKTWENREK